MKTKFFAAFVAFAFVLNAFGTAFADTKKARTARQTNTLAALLPASDGVLTLDVKRGLTEAVPQILSAKPQWITSINSHIDEIKTKTGLDLRQFEQVAVGVSMKQISDKEVDLEPLVLARGKYNPSALIALAKLASKGKYREEKVGAKTVYIFTISEIAEQNKPASADDSTIAPKKDSWFDKAVDRMVNGLLKEVAVTSYDANTMAFGTVARVRETLEGKPRVNAELMNLINRKPAAIAAFAANLPNGLTNFIDLDTDDFGETINSIRQVSGAMELIKGDSAISLTAKTSTFEQGKNLNDILQTLQGVGKSFLGGAKSADKQVFSRMIENVKITQNQMVVSLDLQVPQTDINILLGAK